MSSVSLTKKGNVGVISMDDGKMNSFTFESLDEIQKAACEVENSPEYTSLVLAGNSKAFSAGFDLKIMTGDDRNRAADLILEGGKLALKLYDFKKPVFAAVTGHALAMGGIILLSTDVRIAKYSETSKIGLNEVAIGMDLPLLAIEFARARMTPSNLYEAVSQGKIYSPMGAAQDSGFVDEILRIEDTEEFVEGVVEKAEELAASVKQPAFYQIRQSIRKPTLDFVISTLESDIKKYRPQQ